MDSDMSAVKANVEGELKFSSPGETEAICQPDASAPTEDRGHQPALTPLHTDASTDGPNIPESEKDSLQLRSKSSTPSDRSDYLMPANDQLPTTLAPTINPQLPATTEEDSNQSELTETITEARPVDEPRWGRDRGGYRGRAPTSFWSRRSNRPDPAIHDNGPIPLAPMLPLRNPGGETFQSIDSDDRHRERRRGSMNLLRGARQGNKRKREAEEETDRETKAARTNSSHSGFYSSDVPTARSCSVIPCAPPPRPRPPPPPPPDLRRCRYCDKEFDLNRVGNSVCYRNPNKGE
ncbi:hypothetical protein F4804DRAFT_163979 [Jackrogersella minutella]|nr:hypothetical protein F4804DRAFT_163979 [Jackrogersella minutella]